MPVTAAANRLCGWCLWGQENEGYWETVTDWETKTTVVDGQTQTSQEPVSRQEYRTRTVWKWEQLEWRPGRTVTESGTSQAEVRWPSYTLGERERAGEQHEKYVATFEVPRGGPGLRRGRAGAVVVRAPVRDQHHSRRDQVEAAEGQPREVA
jgi:hypothetical protein